MRKCFSCFNSYNDTLTYCPYCNAPSNLLPKQPIHLTPGTTLQNGRYILGQSVGSGGFGVVYKAYDTNLDTIVAIKEFFISQIMYRGSGLKGITVSHGKRQEFEYRKMRFLAEARIMAKFGNHKSIPNVFEYFEENDTAYIVMELLSGMTLSQYLENNGGSIDAEFAAIIANDIAEALSSLHKEKIIHRDVAPDNIFICFGKEIKIKLMDLGSAKLQNETDEHIDVILKPGFTPIEQYTDNKSKLGPWSDIYALGASLYTMMTGSPPTEASNRVVQDDVLSPRELGIDIPENFNNLIMRAIAVRQHLRFGSIQEFQKALNSGKKIDDPEKAKKKRRVKRVLSIVSASVVVVGAALFGFGLYSKLKTDELLQPAEIEVWFSVSERSSEENAMKSVKEDFESAFPGVTIKLRAIPEKNYQNELENAAKIGRLPALFESTGATSYILNRASSAENVINSEQFKNALFLEQYCDYYTGKKQIPLAIEVPVVFVIVSGAEYIEYSEDYFTNLSDFGYDNILVEESCADLFAENYGYGKWQKGSDGFYDNSENTSAVLLSSTMSINRVRETLTNYEKIYVYPKADKIKCRFTYEWSIGYGSKDEIAAAERLLSWMLGNVYQNTLMISKANDGQIPVNKICFENKIQANNLKPIADIYDKFVF